MGEQRCRWEGKPLPPGGPLVDIPDSPYAFAPEKARTIRYAYLLDVWSIADDWQLTADARYDDYSDFGGTFNPRLALVWQTSERLTTKLLYDKAFRSPNYQELFAETSFSLPNPDLAPERSQTWDLSLSYAPSKTLSLGVNLYRFQQSDVISPQAVPGSSKLRYQNVGKHTIRGVAFEAWWQPMHDLRASGNYAYNDPDEDTLHHVGAPRQQAYLRADWLPSADRQWNAQANWIGKRDRRHSDPRPAVDDYLVMDTTLRYVGWKDWQFAVSVRNIFDADARDYVSASVENDLPLQGRSVFLEARYDLANWLK